MQQTSFSDFIQRYGKLTIPFININVDLILTATQVTVFPSVTITGAPSGFRLHQVVGDN